MQGVIEEQQIPHGCETLSKPLRCYYDLRDIDIYLVPIRYHIEPVPSKIGLSIGYHM